MVKGGLVDYFNYKVYMVGANAILALSLVLCSMHLGRRLAPWWGQMQYWLCHWFFAACTLEDDLDLNGVDVSNKVVVAVLDLHLVEEKEEVSHKNKKFPTKGDQGLQVETVVRRRMWWLRYTEARL